MSTGQTNPKQKTKHFSAVRNRCVVTLVNQLEQLETNEDNNTNNPSAQQQKRNETIKVKKIPEFQLVLRARRLSKFS
jgi:hypothetical protein